VKGCLITCFYVPVAFSFIWYWLWTDGLFLSLPYFEYVLFYSFSFIFYSLILKVIAFLYLFFSFGFAWGPVWSPCVLFPLSDNMSLLWGFRSKSGSFQVLIVSSFLWELLVLRFPISFCINVLGNTVNLHLSNILCARHVMLIGWQRVIHLALPSKLQRYSANPPSLARPLTKSKQSDACCTGQATLRDQP